MNLHLFSSPGERDDIRYIIDAARSYLAGKPDAVVAYLPTASLYGEEWLDQTEKFFDGLARVEMLNTEMMELPEMESILRRAALVYIPGGNTFLLNHRLHISRLMPYLSKKVQAGLPLVAFSAGTILCGPNILTSNDLNMVATPHFDGLNVTPFNFNVHYTGDLAKDNWLVDYHVFYDNPVIIMADGSHIRIEGRKTQLVSGDAWLLRKGQEKEKLKPGALITI
ncbi:MAG: Type 1 glutamine amidotransferase-like domain-containing protein [Anaerolineales bacterium]